MARSRRGVLIGVAGLAAAAGAVFGDRVPLQLPSGFVGPPPTEYRIKTVTASRTRLDNTFLIKKVELFESGAARITLADDHACYERIGVTHEDLSFDSQHPDDALQIWDAPRFGGPIVVDLKSAIQSVDGYPSRVFRLKLIAEAGKFCIAIAINEMEFTVPRSYMP